MEMIEEVDNLKNFKTRKNFEIPNLKKAVKSNEFGIKRFTAKRLSLH